MYIFEYRLGSSLSPTPEDDGCTSCGHGVHKTIVEHRWRRFLEQCDVGGAYVGEVEGRRVSCSGWRDTHASRVIVVGRFFVERSASRVFCTFENNFIAAREDL